MRALLSRLTGRAVYESVTVLPPFYGELGRNLILRGSVPTDFLHGDDSRESADPLQQIAHGDTVTGKRLPKGAKT